MIALSQMYFLCHFKIRLQKYENKQIAFVSSYQSSKFVEK